MSYYVLFFLLLLECHTAEFIASKTLFCPTVSLTTSDTLSRTKSEAHAIY